MSVAETVETKIDYLLPGAAKRNRVPMWPPDVFCLCAAILQSSGAYSRVLDDDRSFKARESSKKRARRLRKVGKMWNASFGGGQTPKEIKDLWTQVFVNRATPLNELGTDAASSCRSALIDLLAAADEACVGLGIYKLDFLLRQYGGIGAFYFQAEQLFVKSMSGPEGATLCKEIHPSRARVLPKMHTPQSGLTIRSLSHHLGFCPGSDMRPNWYSLASKKSSHSFNLLLIPWPEVVDPSQFIATKKRGLNDDVREDGYGMFTFLSKQGPTVEYVRRLLLEAEQRVGHVDGIVFPELAMTEPEFVAIAQAFSMPDRFVIAGAGRAADKTAGMNSAILEVVDPILRDKAGDLVHIRIPQKKHHRWKLEKNQIVQYSIGSNLHPLANWWEHIELGDREISFVSFQPWLTMSVLICEDLARPDPVGDIIRSVGPNLIIALLSDGPQIGSRWPGRYASGFADDPGSSVLTLTSVGMARLSRPSGESKDRSDVVALWRDAKIGTREIACPRGYEGVVLNITAEYHEEWTADGRGDGKNSGYPVLSGYHLLESPSWLKGKRQDDHDHNQGRGNSIPLVETAQSAPTPSLDKTSGRRRKAARSQPDERKAAILGAHKKRRSRLKSEG
jgi:hypothetical protein